MWYLHTQSWAQVINFKAFLPYYYEIHLVFMYQVKVLHGLQNENMLMAAQYVMFFARGITVSIFASFVGVLQNAKKGEVFSMWNFIYEAITTHRHSTHLVT